MNRLMATRYVADLQRKNPTPLTCWVEDSEPGLDCCIWERIMRITPSA